MAEGQRFEVFTVVKRAQQSGEDKSWWVRVGAAFTNKDGSINVRLDALPVNGELQLRVPRERDEQPPPQGGRRQQRGGGEQW